MQLFSVGKLLALAALPLAACEPASTARAPLPTLQAASTEDALHIVARNARAIGGKTQKVGGDALIVLYKGGPRGYFACTTEGSAAAFQSGAYLDARTSLVAADGGLQLETVYIATTSGKAGPASVVFSNIEPGKLADGGRCQSTQKFEEALLRQR